MQTSRRAEEKPKGFPWSHTQVTPGSYGTQTGHSMSPVTRGEERPLSLKTGVNPWPGTCVPGPLETWMSSMPKGPNHRGRGYST